MRHFELVWTPSRTRRVKTVKRANQAMRAWKLWQERKGHRVSSAFEGYYVSSAGLGISLREYDKDGKRIDRLAKKFKEVPCSTTTPTSGGLP